MPCSLLVFYSGCRPLNSLFLDRCIYLVFVGTSNWTVSRDYKCSPNDTMKVQASLNSCMENFICPSGDCIPMVQRCNGINDCSDGFDEVNCKVGNLAVKSLKVILHALQAFFDLWIAKKTNFER